EDDRLVLLRLGVLEPLRRLAHPGARVARLGQPFLHCLADRRVVLDDQDVHELHPAGMSDSAANVLAALGSIVSLPTQAATGEELLTMPRRSIAVFNKPCATITMRVRIGFREPRHASSPPAWR